MTPCPKCGGPLLVRDAPPEPFEGAVFGPTTICKPCGVATTTMRYKPLTPAEFIDVTIPVPEGMDPEEFRREIEAALLEPEDGQGEGDVLKPNTFLTPGGEPPNGWPK